MKFVQFALLVLATYGLYFGINILLDLARIKKSQAAALPSNKNMINTESLFANEEEVVPIMPSFQADAEEAMKPTVHDLNEALALETISYGITVSAENITALFAE